MAYADPPYLGQSTRHYAGEVDHHTLIDRLVTEFPDGWALSCSTPSLRTLLPMCPEQTRVAAWVKPFHAYKRGVRPAYAWEPVLFLGGRNTGHPPPPKGGEATTPKDFVITEAPAVAVNITLRRGLVGARPAGFCWWLFDPLGGRAGDEFVDLFPESGAVGEAWEQWTRQPSGVDQLGLWATPAEPTGRT